MERQQYYKAREAFVNYFSVERIAKMSLDEYAIGRGNKASFCYRIERELEPLGRIIGQPSNKYGVWYSRQHGEYVADTRFGYDVDDVFKLMKALIIELIEAGSKEDIEAIINSPISNMFKGKILSTYFPDKYLNIFSKSHLKYYLKSLNLDSAHLMDQDPIIMRQALVDFKNSDEDMRRWSMDMFATFLWSHYPGSPIKQEQKDIRQWEPESDSQQIIALYEEYSRLDEGELLDIIKKGLIESIHQIVSRLEDYSQTFYQNKNRTEEEKQRLLDILQHNHELIKDKPINRSSIIEIKECCDVLLSLSKKHDYLSYQISRTREQLNRLEYLLSHTSSVHEFRESCMSLILSIDKKFSKIVNKYDFSSNLISKLIVAIAPILASALGTLPACTAAIMAISLDVYIETLKKEKNIKDSSIKTPPRKSQSYDLIEMGLKKGNVLEWRKNNSIKAIIHTSRTVMYNGTEIALSKLTANLKKSASKYLNPLRYWFYKGRLLEDLK